TYLLLEVAERRNAIQAHIEDVILEDADVGKVAVGDRDKPNAAGVNGILWVGVGMDAAGRVDHKAEGGEEQNPADTTGDIVVRLPDKGDAAECNAIAVATEEAIPAHFDTLRAAPEVESATGKNKPPLGYGYGGEAIEFNEDIVSTDENER